MASHPHSTRENQRPQAEGEQVVRGRGRQTQRPRNPQEGEAAPPPQPPGSHLRAWGNSPKATRIGGRPSLWGQCRSSREDSWIPSPPRRVMARSGTAADALDAARHREDGSSAVQTRTGSRLEAGGRRPSGVGSGKPECLRSQR